jgi:intein/homing endonuclease
MKKEIKKKSKKGITDTSRYVGDANITRNYKKWKHRLLIATPTTGNVRMEWVHARYGQVIPCNWSHVEVHQAMNSFLPLNYQIADAENLTAKMVVEGDYEWLCFQGETLVETDKGAKQIKDVQVGDTVKTHLGNYQKVTKKYVNPIKQRDPMTWVRTENTTIKSTPNHPYFADREGVRAFIPAKNLKAGDSLLYPREKKEDKIKMNLSFNLHGEGYHGLVGGKRATQKVTEIVVDKDFARYLGLFLAEGHVMKDGIAFTFNNNETEYIDFVMGESKKLFGREAKTTNTKWQTWATQVRLSIRNLAPIFDSWLGGGAKKKKVPSFVFGWNLENKLAFIEGYLDGDGTYRKDGAMMFSSASKALIEGMVDLLSGCGLSVGNTYKVKAKDSIIKSGDSKGKVIHGGEAYSVYLPVKSVEKFYDLIGAKEGEEYAMIPVTGVEEHYWAASLKDNNVYNLEVKGDNSYIAGCAAVHNCSIEDDNVIPQDAFIKINEYMTKGNIPIVSGVYFTKSVPPEPILYRNETNGGYFADWKMGEKVWVSGIPFGFTLIHASIIKALWDESPEYVVNGITTRRVFHAPNELIVDEETGLVRASMGTSDLAWCKKMMKEGFFTKAGWPEYQNKENPFLVDTSIFVSHVDRSDGTMYPRELPTAFLQGKITWKEALQILTA